jgi:hypothetical protein
MFKRHSDIVISRSFNGKIKTISSSFKILIASNKSKLNGRYYILCIPIRDAVCNNMFFTERKKIKMVYKFSSYKKKSQNPNY